MTKSLFHTLSAAWSLLVWSILISSCTDDLKSSQTTDRIRFTSAIDNTWTSLATDGGEGTRSAVSALRTEGTPLYTDSIQPPSAENAGDSVPVTRSAPRDIASMYGTFGVSAYAYQGTWDNTGTPNYMNDVAVSKSGNAWTPSAGSYYWPGASYTMRFYAYAPKGNSAYTFSTSGIPTLTCAIPSDVAGQQDLLVAASGAVSGGNNEAIGLTFRHALTAVKFVCGSDMKAGTVKSVTLKGVYATGTYNLETAAWSDVRTPKNFSQTLDAATEGTEGSALTSAAQTFMMLPQTLPDTAKIEIVFDDGQAEHTLTGAIGKQVWPMGKTVTYKISTSSINWEYTLSVTGTEHFTHDGGTNSYQITSYRTNSIKGTKEPAPWTAEFSTDGQNWTTRKPDWVTAFTANGNGSLEASSYDATLSSTEGITSNGYVKEYKTLYDASGKAYTSAPEMDDFSGNKVSGTTITAKKNIAISIQRPTTMQKRTRRGFSSYANLWDATQDIQYDKYTPIVDQTVVKTIYDPCPPGFCLPPAILFSGMSISNQFTEVSTKVSDVADLNALYPSAHGVTIYGGLNKTGDKIFNPALGAIESTNDYQLLYLDEEADLWTATGGSNRNYVFWSFTTNQVIHVGSSPKDSGLPVRGIKEQ